MQAGDLTTIENAKIWLNIGAQAASYQPVSAGDEPLIGRLITAASGVIMDHLNRGPLHLRTVTETYDGWGGTQLVLKQWPAHRVIAVRFLGRSVDESLNAGSTGYRLQDREAANGGQQALFFINTRVPNERQSIEVVYEAGYARDETRVLPEVEGSAQTVKLTPYSLSLGDLGVTDAEGVELTRVRTGTPGAGEYKIGADGGYLFPASMAGDEVSIRYSYVPTILEDCAIQMVGQKFKSKENIGVSSKSLAGQETITFDKRDMTPSIVSALTAWRRVA